MLFADSAFCTTPFCAPAARTLNAALSETAEISDSVVGVSTIPVAISETANASDAVTAVSIIPTAIAETAEISDSVANTNDGAAPIAEILEGVDSVAAQLDAVANIAPYAQVSETVTAAGSVLSVVPAETADAAGYNWSPATSAIDRIEIPVPGRGSATGSRARPTKRPPSRRLAS